ncbi:uncharacterized protein LOC111338416 [Stylophora pistillata]|uniref:uncharacterized protein LOC111338416 n=1 Tax=Stylophora pistillata TaxID=50429 RepID=UPI000C04ECAB|nr:uncharacterized protein LOC111338416 [Stylophora pistillata]
MNKSATFAFLLGILIVSAVPGYKGNLNQTQGFNATNATDATQDLITTASNATQGSTTTGYFNSTQIPTPSISVAPTNSSLPMRCSRKTVLLNKKSKGRIRSPNHPNNYDTNQVCTWKVQVRRGFLVKARFRSIDLENSDECKKDRVVLSSSKQFRDPHIHCGSVEPFRFISKKNILWVRFYSDHSVTGKGFIITYSAIDENECDMEMCTFPTLCRNTVGSFECDCPKGYDNKGPKQKATCVDTNECKINNGGCQHKCVNTGGSYYCKCRKGYKLAPDGKRCRADRNVCTKDNGGCSHFCINMRSSYRCACPSGYALNTKRKTCYREISFANDQYMVKVSESAQRNTVVTKLQARTFPERRIISYALLSENLKEPTVFKINSRTGEIILRKRPNISEMRTFLLEIEASSFDGTKQRSAKAFVLINFSKVQSRGGSLSFTHASLYIRVPCNTPSNTTVYRVQTKNTGRGGGVRISFQRKLDHFSITGGGKIKTQRSLRPFCDVTPSKTFRTYVAARDSSDVKRNAHALLRIEITPPILLPYTGNRR